MIIPCFRCGKELESPNDKNADYIIASDTIVKEERDVLIALVQNSTTQSKTVMKEKLNSDGTLEFPDLVISDDEYDQVEIANAQAAKNISGLVKIVVVTKEKDIQKTGIICPDDYKPTDTVIWGVHKEA